jgi:hypothetical protein
MKFGLFLNHFMVYNFFCGEREKAGAKGSMGFSWKKWAQVTTSKV